MTAIILAGGMSSRMGFDKQFLRVGDKLLIDIIIEKLRDFFYEIIIVTNKPKDYIGYDCTIIRDEIIGFGPLAGIHAGLNASNSQYNYILACDMPFIDIKYIEYMKNILNESENNPAAVVTKFGNWIEPFNAFYSKDLLEIIEDSINNKERKIGSMLKKADVIYIEEKEAREFSKDWHMFANLNTRHDLDEYIRNITI